MGDRQHAIALYNQGVEASKQNQYPTHLQHAYKLFASACFADPTWWQAFYQAGNNNVDQKLGFSALACFRRALQCEITDPVEHARVFANMCWQLEESAQVDEALECGLKSIEADPNCVLGHLNLSVVYRDLDDTANSVKHAEQAYAIDPTNMLSEINMAFANLFARNFATGLKFFEKRFEWRLHHFLHYPYPQWHGEKGKTVVLVADQGLGDTLSYARFVRQACERAGYVHAIVQHELMRLFQHAFVDIKNLNIIPGLQANFPAADAWTTFVSLPNALGLNDDEIRNAPQIKAPHFSLPKSWKVKDRKFHIGIAWGGSPLNDIDRHRNIPMTEFYELYRVPGVQLYSLQVGERGREMVDSGGAPLIGDLTPYIHDIVDTVALMQDLDLVITVESALGHICALAEKEAWIPYSFYGRDYRIGLTGEDQLWSKHTIFRQDKTAQWRPVFNRIIAALQDRLQTS